ncbi:MAG: flagellar hook protein FlgE [Bryobacteraceae bacterium]
MFASFSTALSALDANSTAVDVVGNNLANLNTPGYKDSVAYFHDLVTESMGTGTTQVGFGVGEPMTIRRFTQGTIQASGGPLDAAIQGDGFFVVQSGGVKRFTRAGSFQVDLSGNLLTPTGERVQGWTGTNGIVNTGGPIGDIVLPVGGMQVPVATGSFSLDANLNSAAAADASSNWSTTVQIYDSLGASHVLTIDFQKTAVNQWQYTITMPGEDFTGGTAGTPNQLTQGNLTFGTDGTLSSATTSPITVDIKGLASGASDIAGLQWNLYASDGTTGRITQYGEKSAPSANSQDGSPAAQLTGVTMGDGGELLASYSSGKQVVVGQIAMASIRNPESLVAVGNNDYQLSAASAAPAIGLPGTGGRGTVKGGALESSNVDIAREFTSLIVLQSAYQANSKVVTTANQMSQTTTNLIT